MRYKLRNVVPSQQKLNTKRKMKETNTKDKAEQITEISDASAPEDSILKDAGRNEVTQVLEEAKDTKVVISELEVGIEQLKRELEQEREKNLRTLADYDNFRKRTQSEFGRIIKTAGERLIAQMLPVLDDFERLFDHDPSELKDTSLLKGVEMIRQKLNDVLTSEGLQSIEAVGEPFDAELHEAMAQIKDRSKPDGVIIEETEKGYRLGDKIIRFSKVIVNSCPVSEEEESDE